MNRLDQYAIGKEQEKDVVKRAAVKMLRSGQMDEAVLKRTIELAYQYGHHAGHCRGESYKQNLSEGII